MLQTSFPLLAHHTSVFLFKKTDNLTSSFRFPTALFSLFQSPQISHLWLILQQLAEYILCSVPGFFCKNLLSFETSSSLVLSFWTVQNSSLFHIKSNFYTTLDNGLSAITDNILKNLRWPFLSHVLRIADALPLWIKRDISRPSHQQSQIRGMGK